VGCYGSGAQSVTLLERVTIPCRRAAQLSPVTNSPPQVCELQMC